MFTILPEPFSLYYTGVNIQDATKAFDLYPYDYNPRDDYYRDIRLTARLPQDTNAINLKFLDYDTLIKTSTPLKVSSSAKISDTFNTESLNIYSSTNDNAVQRRDTVYGSTDFIYLTDLTVYPSAEYPAFGTDGSKHITAVPNVKGNADLLSGLDLQINGNIDWSSVGAATLNNRLDIPEQLSGFVPKQFIDSDMTTTNPESIAWGLLAALAVDDTQLSISILRAVSKIGILYGLITETGEVITENETGLPIIINPATYVASTESVVWANSLLGFALVKTINRLQDRFPLSYIKLYGSYKDFMNQVLGVIKSLAQFVSYSISPLSNETSYSYIFSTGTFDFSVLCLRGSVYTSLFLTQYLAIAYDNYLHTRVSLLYLGLLDSSPDINEEGAFERYTLNLFTVDSLISPTTAESDLYTKMVYSVILAIFNVNFANDSKADLYLTQYTTLRTTLLLTYNGVYIPTDYLVSYLHDLRGTTTGWLDVFNSTAVANLNTLSSTSLSIEHLTQVYLTQVHYYIYDQSSSFNLGAEEAVAQVTAVLYEIRRMWPQGTKWTKMDLENSIHSVIGSLLYAMSQINYGWYLYYNIVRKSSTMSTAVGPHAIMWLQLVVPNSLIVSSTFASYWLSLFVSRNKSDIESSSLLLNVDVDVSYPQPAPFSIYV